MEDPIAISARCEDWELENAQKTAGSVAVDMTQGHQATHSEVSGCRSGVPGPGISPYHSAYHSQSPPGAVRDHGKVKAGRAQPAFVL